MRFLNPTAKPDAAPHVGRVGGAARAAGRAEHVVGGRGPAAAAPAQARMTSATGAVPVDDLAGDSWSPGASALRRRSSTGSRPQRGGELVHLGLVGEARLHRAEARASRRTAGCWCARRSRRCTALGTRYGPAAKHAALASTADDVDGVGAAVEHEPRLDLHELAVGVGGVAHPDARRVAVHVAEERLLAEYTIFTGRPVRSASRHEWTCRLTSSRAPNAPPTPPRVSRTSSSGEPEAGGDLVAVVVQPLGRDEQVDARRRRSGMARPASGPRNAWSCMPTS